LQPPLFYGADTDIHLRKVVLHKIIYNFLFTLHGSVSQDRTEINKLEWIYPGLKKNHFWFLNFYVEYVASCCNCYLLLGFGLKNILETFNLFEKLFCTALKILAHFLRLNPHFLLVYCCEKLFGKAAENFLENTQNMKIPKTISKCCQPTG
jgi:hypothetical protein